MRRTPKQAPELGARAQGWLRFLWRKATTDDDWTEGGEPHPWWDRYSTPPMTSFPRFDLSESSYALGMMADVTPAWREVYTEILDRLVERHTTFWAAVDWLTQFGHDPKRGEYPEAWKGRLVPEHLWGEYDAPGWTANGIEPWGLQSDPIGADGNLFFRGFFNLVLSTYRAVSGSRKWDRPFQVAGVDGTRHEWTHADVARFLSEQWAGRPEGPHCENTKIWPYCLSAAGLGLQLFDRVEGTGLHWVFDRWLEHAEKHYMVTSDDGRLESMALYYDPILDYAHQGGPAGGLAPAFYILPQHRPMAERLYEVGIEALGWRDPDVEIDVADPRIPAIVLTLARELRDDVVEQKIRDHAEAAYEPRRFGERDREFGYFFETGEEWPRGQLSGLMICADVGEPGGWRRLFRRPDLEKFDQPTVTGIEFPSLGVACARYDVRAHRLDVATAVGDPSQRGAMTSFRVEQLPESSAVQVRRDGHPYDRFRTIDEDTIEIESEIVDTRFEIEISGRGAGDRWSYDRTTEDHSGSWDVSFRPRRASHSQASALKDAQRLVSGGGGLCPCCS